MDLDEIEREMKALAVEYIQELPERFRALSAQVSELKEGRGDALQAKSEAHKIKGTASSYGLHDIGEQAVVIDTCLKKVCEKPETVTPALWEELTAALAEALRLAKKALAEL